MARTLLLIGTRKGVFFLESNDRKTWELHGPFCEGWPVYHVIHDPQNGAVYAAAASEWHGQTVWRSGDLGETWTQSSEGIAYDAESGRKISKVSTLAVSDGRLLVGVEALGISALMFDREDADRFWAIVQGVGLFETTDYAESWTPRNRGLRADWPREHDEVGFCVHKLVRSPADGDRMYQQNHVGMHRSDDAGQTWTEITEGLPTEFGFAAAAHPHDRDTFYVIPLDPGHGRTMPEGHAAVWRTRDAGSSWQRLDSGLPQRDAYVGVLREAMAVDSEDAPGLYFGTSTGQVFASTDEGDTWAQIADYLPPISSVEVAAIE